MNNAAFINIITLNEDKEEMLQKDAPSVILYNHASNLDSVLVSNYFLLIKKSHEFPR